jgi:hypothetical protein
MELTQACETVRRELPDATLTLVGEENWNPAVREAAARIPSVATADFCEGRELARHYPVSDVSCCLR